MTDDFLAIMHRTRRAIDLTPPTSTTAMVSVDDLRTLLASCATANTALHVAVELAVDIVQFENTTRASRTAQQLVRILGAALTTSRDETT